MLPLLVDPLVSVALAQVSPTSVFTEDYGLVVDPSSDPLTVNGVGAPTIAFDEADDVWVMFFETRIAAADTVCPAGQWGIGVASSQDGETWDIWPSLAVAPTAGTPHACVAAHPAVVYDAGTFHLWFKAEQGTNVTVDQGWGTNNYSGIGYATIDLSLDDKTADIAAIDAAIVALETALDAAVLDFDSAVTALEADLYAAESEFTCLPDAPLCAPCTSVALAVVQFGAGATTSSRDFCQPFDFVVPANPPGMSLTGSGLTLNDLARLNWTPTPGGGNERCVHRVHQTTGAIQYTCTETIGSTVSADSVTLRGQVGSSAATQLFANITLNATNGASQVFQGALFDSIDAIQPFSSVPDPDGTLALLTPFTSNNGDLSDLIGWLDDPPISSTEQALLDDARALRTRARQLRSLTNSTNSQITSLLSQRDALVNYTQHVTPNVTGNSVALQVNQVVGYPSVGRLGGQWVMLVQRYPDLFRATGATPSALTLDASASILHGTTTWANTEVFEPAMFCDPGSAFEYGTWLGGRTTVASVITSAGASDAVSTNAVDWLLNTTADFGWANADDYRHFDVVADANGELRMYWVQRVGGINEVHMKSTTSTWDSVDTLNRVCAAVP